MPTDVLVPALMWLVTGLSIFGSEKPNYKRVTSIACFILSTGVTGIIVMQRHEEGANTHERKAAAYKQLDGATTAYLHLLAYAVFAASDGPPPNTREDFFSARTADLLCDQLDPSHPPSFHEGPTWRDQINRDSKAYRSALASVDQSLLSAEQVKLVNALQSSPLLAAGAMSIAMERMGTPSPFLCQGLEDQVAGELQQLNRLEASIRESAAEFGLPPSEWLQYPRQTELRGVNRIGKAPPPAGSGPPRWMKVELPN